ncbi:MAG: hypothetical protein IKV35_05565 [Clostridia bacterium]|nr:hypothetical protein [Clostridia bacterium]
MNIETIWNNVKLHEGETFYKKRGDEYTYSISNDVVIVNEIKGGRITKSALAKALTLPNPTPRKIELAGCWAPSYIYGLITDSRITNV